MYNCSNLDETCGGRKSATFPPPLIVKLYKPTKIMKAKRKDTEFQSYRPTEQVQFYQF